MLWMFVTDDAKQYLIISRQVNQTKNIRQLFVPEWCAVIEAQFWGQTKLQSFREQFPVVGYGFHLISLGSEPAPLSNHCSMTAGPQNMLQTAIA